MLALRSRSLYACGALFALVSLATLYGCRSAPITERKQLLLVPETQEISMGRSAFQEILDQQPQSSNAAYNELVTRIGQRIAAVANRPDYEWDFRVLASEEQNAFCLPGGKVGVYEGMIPLCQNEAELAVVISHEVAHALQRHGGERMSQGYVTNAFENAVKYATKGRDEVLQQRILTAYGVASKYGVVLPYSRQHELEADRVGLLLMAQAGYDPTVAPGFWERFAQAAGPKPPEFLSTHPADLRRAQELRDVMSEAQDRYAQATNRIGVGQAIAMAPPASGPPPADGSPAQSFAPTLFQR